MRQVHRPVLFPVAEDDANAECVTSLKIMKKENLQLCKKEMSMELKTSSTSAERHEKNSRYINLKPSRARFSTLAPFVLLGILSEFVVPLIIKRKISISKKRTFKIVYILVLHYPIFEMQDLTLLIVKYHWKQITVLEHVQDLKA